MDPAGPRTPQETPAARWLGEHAATLFAAIRCVVADSLCAYDESARSPLPLDETARDVLATLERTAPSPRALSTLRASGLVKRAPGEVRREA